MKNRIYFALALIVATGEAFAGSLRWTASLLREGRRRLITVAAKGLPISEAEAAARYLDLSPRAQVAADVAAEETTSQHRHDVTRLRENVR
jgi:hypothetical protein